MWSKPESGNCIGILAGEGHFPVLLAEAVSVQKKKVVVFGIKEHFDEAIGKFASQVHRVDLGGVEAFVDLLKKYEIKKLILAGGVPKTQLFDPQFKMDRSANKIFHKPSNRGDDHLLSAFQIFLHIRCGVSIVDPRRFLKDSLCPRGVLTKRAPTEEEWQDLKFGSKTAQGVGKMDIGQTVVVKNRVVLAVEALEGTDHAILRGGELGQGEVIVVKRSKPNQNLRFDLPCVGLETLSALKTVSSRVLGLEAGRTFLIMKNELIQAANSDNISIIGL